MKLASLAPGALVLLLVSCGAPNKTTSYQATDVQMVDGAPVTVVNTFKAQYPNATNEVWAYYDPVETGIPIEWQVTGYVPYANSRLVHFNQGGETYQVIYDQNGEKVATAVVVTDVNTLPTSLRDQLLSIYPNYVISALSRVTLNKQDNKMAYMVDMKKMYYTNRILIDDNGKILDQRSLVNDKPDPAGMKKDNDK